MFNSFQEGPQGNRSWISQAPIYERLEEELHFKIQNMNPPQEMLIYSQSTMKQKNAYVDRFLPMESTERHIKRKFKRLIKQLSKEDTIQTKEYLYEMITKYDIYRDQSIIEDIILPYTQDTNFIGFMREIIYHSDQAKAIKLALVVYSHRKENDIVDAITILGTDDEYTLYAIDAVRNLVANPDPYYFKMAKHVLGWGRIFAVDALYDTKDEIIQDWIIKEGYYNQISIQYTALTVAKTGRMLERLGNDTIEDEVLLGIGALIEHLALQGPIDGLEGYERVLAVTNGYLKHTLGTYSHIQVYSTYRALLTFLQCPNYDWGAISEFGLTKAVRLGLIETLTQELNNHRGWRPLLSHLKNVGRSQYYFAYAELADKYDVDLDDAHLDRLALNPLNVNQWERVLNSSTEIEKIAAFAETYLPLEVFEEEELSQDVIRIIGELFDQLSLYEGYGSGIVMKTLKANSPKLRLMTIRLLSQWSKENFSDALKLAIREQFFNEKGDRLRMKLAPLLSKEE